MDGRRAPQGLDAEDRIALGLTAQRLAYLVISSLAAYALLTSQLPGVLKYPVGVFALALGAALAWGRLAHRSVDTWLWLGVRFYTRPRRAARPRFQAPQPSANPSAASPQPAAAVTVATPEPVLPGAKQAEAEAGDDDDDLGGGRILSLPGGRRLADVYEEDSPGSYHQEPPAVNLPPAAPVFIGATQRIAFFSLKGGAGKTTLACEVAALLARDARHRTSPGAPPERLRVALLDVDMGSANVSMKLGLTHPTLWDLVIDPAPTSARIDQCLLEHEDSGLRVVLGPPRAIASSESRALAMQRLAQVLSYLDEHLYHFVFIDMSSEINELTTYVLEAVHHIYYVLTPTASGVQDTYRGVETLRRMGHRRKLRFVLNQRRGSFDPSEMLSDLGGSVAASVPRNDAFLNAEDGHRPASLDPSSDARAGISDLAAAIYPGYADVPSAPSVWRRLRQRFG